MRLQINTGKALLWAGSCRAPWPQAGRSNSQVSFSKLVRHVAMNPQWLAACTTLWQNTGEQRLYRVSLCISQNNLFILKAASGRESQISPLKWLSLNTHSGICFLAMKYLPGSSIVMWPGECLPWTREFKWCKIQDDLSREAAENTPLTASAQ